MPTVTHLLEAAVYAQDIEAAQAFYGGVLDLPLVAKDPKRHATFQAGPNSIVLVFRPEETSKQHHLPSHGAIGTGHVALGIAAGDLDAWRQHLLDHGVAIEQEKHWEHGGRSLYFRDPAGNVVELATPGVWGLPSGW